MSVALTAALNKLCSRTREGKMQEECRPIYWHIVAASVVEETGNSHPTLKIGTDLLEPNKSLTN